jgi:hypothetical protein
MGSRTRDLPACSVAPHSSMVKLIQLINTDTIQIDFIHWPLTTMKCVLSGTVALALHHNLPLMPLHDHFIVFVTTPQLTPPNWLHFTILTSRNVTALHFHFTALHLTSLHFTSFHFTSLHFTSLHFTTYFMIYTTLSLHLMYHFPNLLSKIAWFTRESP